VKVVIGDQVTTTAANGSFTIKAATMPYTLHVVVPKELSFLGPKDGTSAMSFVGLTSTSPILRAYANVTPSKATVKGTVSGGSTTGVYRWIVFVDAPQAGNQSGQTGGSSNASPKEYDLTTTWPAGQSQQSLSLAALEYKIPSGLPIGEGIPTEYVSKATGFTTVAASATAENQVGAFSPAETTLLDVEVDLPAVAGWSIKRWTLWLVGAQGAEISFTEDTGTSARAVHVPKGLASIPKARIGVQASTSVLGEFSTHTQLAGTGSFSSVQITIRKSPVPDKPAEAATGVKVGDLLSWDSVGEDCLYTAILRAQTDGSTAFALQTTATSVTIPDLAAHGAGLTASTPYEWYVTCDLKNAPKASIDADAVLGGAASNGGAVSRYMHFVTQ